VSDQNQTLLNNIAYDVNISDYTKVFDKSNINESYSGRDARYIINDFCNQVINYNIELDAFNYATNGAIQSAWSESGDGANPTTSSTNREGDYSGSFSWVNSSDTASYTYTPTAFSIKDFTGVTSGQPTKGMVGFWLKCTDFSAIDSIALKVGSGASDYIELDIEATSNEWTYITCELSEGTATGTPNWEAVDYIQLVIEENASSSILIDGLRVLEIEHFKHYPFVKESVVFENFRVADVKPIEVMQRLADELSWYWYIDYDRNIHFFDDSTNVAPFSIDEASNNFTDLQIDYDASRLINRQKIKGGDETSISFYDEIREGDLVTREWLMKSKFKNLEVSVDDNTVTDLTESGTDTTNITIAGHSLATGDYIVNRTRSNAVRRITYVDANNFTVETVTSQTSGDTLSFFATKVVGVEGLSGEAGNNYMSNFNEKSIRSSETEATLTTGQFIHFKYNEVLPITLRRSDATSIDRMKNVLGHTDGIFEGQPIVDRTLKSRAEATSVALAVLKKYSNVIITSNFKTHVAGLKSGQLIRIKDTDSSTRNIDQDFIIQRVKVKQVEEGENEYTVTCSSLLFGMLELLQQLLRQGRKIEVNEDDTIENVEDALEAIQVSDETVYSQGGEIQGESIEVSDTSDASIVEPPFKWADSVDKEARWNLFVWG